MTATILRKDWIPLSERKPDHLAICFIANEEGDFDLAEYDAEFAGGSWFSPGFDGDVEFKVTHWQPVTVELP